MPAWKHNRRKNFWVVCCWRMMEGFQYSCSIWVKTVINCGTLLKAVTTDLFLQQVRSIWIKTVINCGTLRKAVTTDLFLQQEILFVRTLDVRTTPLVTDHCMLTAVVPLNKDNLMEGQTSWLPKQSLQRQFTVYWLLHLLTAAFTAASTIPALTAQRHGAKQGKQQPVQLQESTPTAAQQDNISPCWILPRVQFFGCQINHKAQHWHQED